MDELKKDDVVAPITILIPTHNRARSLEVVWSCYVGNPLVEKIVIVNDGSTDNTGDVVRKLSGFSPTKVHLIEHPTRMGQQVSRMSAIAAAQTEWVLFGEDDVWLSPEYCSTLLRQAGELGADIIAGRLVTVRVRDEFTPQIIRDDEDVAGTSENVFDMRNLAANFAPRIPMPIPAPYLHTIALIKRSIFDQVQFDTYYAGNGNREETDFYLSAGAIGARLYFTPSAACYHIRGPICGSGGQRINRLAFEYFTIKNTMHLISKHWPMLKKQHGFCGSPATWVLGYLCRRQWRQFRRILQGDYISTLKG